MIARSSTLAGLSTVTHFQAGLVLPLLLTVLMGCAAATPAAVDNRSPAGFSFSSALDDSGYRTLASVLTDAHVDSLLEGTLASEPGAERRAAAVLIALGALTSEDVESPVRTSAALAAYQAAIAEPRKQSTSARVGRIGEASLIARLHQKLDHSDLLAQADVLAALGQALSDGVLTGYDLRASGVYDGFEPGHTFVYSHQSLSHLRQLVTMLALEGVDADVHVTPKVSAFLHREEWGEPGPNVVTLEDGTRVVQGREMAVLFRFDSPFDRMRFHSVVQTYAKRDSDDETGLIDGAWWQPFYYSDQPLVGFQPISLLVVQAGAAEATLTVLNERVADVSEALATLPWPIRRDRVWVNPAFHRFLGGGYR